MFNPLKTLLFRPIWWTAHEASLGSCYNWPCSLSTFTSWFWCCKLEHIVNVFFYSKLVCENYFLKIIKLPTNLIIIFREQFGINLVNLLPKSCFHRNAFEHSELTFMQSKPTVFSPHAASAWSMFAVALTDKMYTHSRLSVCFNQKLKRFHNFSERWLSYRTLQHRLVPGPIPHLLL